METELKNSSKYRDFQSGAFNLPQRFFMSYVRTLQFMKSRLKGIEEDEAVHINQKEIEQRFFIYPEHPRKDELKGLVDSGELEIFEKFNQTTGKKMLMYRAVNPTQWPLELKLIKPKETNYGTQTKLMQSHLMSISLPRFAPSTPYFDFFLQNRKDYLDYFFTVDSFSGRVHTPVTSFPKKHRTNILIGGSETIGLDVATMQPMLLGKILREQIGANRFSNWIDSGEDIYIMLQRAAKLETRDQGKKRFFEILFAPPSNELSEMFGDANWIRWINNYKQVIQKGNPHSINKRYSNLAWLLQTTEVKTMRKVWQLLNESNILFLTVHDEIIVKEKDRFQTEGLFRKVLDSEFTNYSLNVKGIRLP